MRIGKKGNVRHGGAVGSSSPLFGKIGAYVLFALKPQVSEPNSTHA
jgi:hypothetical protein